MNQSQEQTKKVAVVTGSSSGIGFETSLLLARNGYYVYATMRNIEIVCHSLFCLAGFLKCLYKTFIFN